MIGRIVAVEIVHGALWVFGALLASGALFHLFSSVIHHVERVRARTVGGMLQPADIIGASKLREGEWQRTKVRFYSVGGEALWTQGDGFSEMGVMKKNGIFIVRTAR